MAEQSRNYQPRRWMEHIVTAEEAGRTVEEIVTGSMSISRRMIQKLTRGQGILLNRRPAFLGKKVREGDTVSARAVVQEEAMLERVKMDLSIVHEDADVLVVDKPPFVLVHPTQPDQTETLAHGIAYHFWQHGISAKVRPVHRLDRDTSGLLLVAKTAFAHQHLDRQLRERELKREYLALVDGTFDEDAGTIDAPIGKHKLLANLRAVRPNAGEPAVTHWRVAERYPRATLLELELETGRTHQIRVHMAHAGHPLLGDRQYGGPPAPGLRRQALHASRLAFTHPTCGERMTFQAPLPEDLARVREGLRRAPA
ncbi:MAG TPA: RluA family pseudouridine synthase [Longimicrobiaceae bacterium]|nr:RluA family pseudouridine synthase [Longimicrobiaceae bacterium]